MIGLGLGAAAVTRSRHHLVSRRRPGHLGDVDDERPAAPAAAPRR